MNKNILMLQERRLAKAIQDFEKRHILSDEITKLDLDISIQETLMSILDYLATNTSNEFKYCPRPNGELFDDFIENYLKRLGNNAKLSQIGLDFAKELYDLSKKHDFAIGKLNGKVKHEKPSQFGDKNIELEGSYYGELLLQIPQDGNGFSIPGIMNLKGGSINIVGCSVKTPDFEAKNINLRYNKPGDFDAHKVYHRDGTNDQYLIRISDCIEICKGIIKYCYSLSD